jgi:hypothetical protein
MFVLLVVPHVLHAAVVAAPGYAVQMIATPDTVEGGVVQRGDAILVGQGPGYTAGAQSIVRLDAGGTTTIATGFNSLGGFDLATDGTLYVVDNCSSDDGDFCGTTATGDTVYAIPDALTRTTPVAAAGQEVVPAGTIPFAADVLVTPDGALLVSDAVGNGIGRVVKIASGTPTDLISSLDLVGGLTFATDGTLRVVDAVLNMDFTTTGKVLKYQLDGTSLGTLVNGLQGGFGGATDADGNVLVTGNTKLVAVASDGSVTDRATGFAFSSDVFFDAARDEALVLDFGVNQITGICRDRDGDGVCDADDDCPLVADADQTDTDGDGIGDACDPCTGAAIDKPKLSIGKVLAPTGDDTLAFKGVMTIPPVPALDPVTTGARVIVPGVVDATIPASAFDDATKKGWKAGKNGAFTYVDGTGGISGIVKLALKPSKKTPGAVQFTVGGKKGSYPVDPATLPTQATLIVDASAGQCGDASFAGPAPAPVCVFKAKNGKVQCK